MELEKPGVFIKAIKDCMREATNGDEKIALFESVRKDFQSDLVDNLILTKCFMTYDQNNKWVPMIFWLVHCYAHMTNEINKRGKAFLVDEDSRKRILDFQAEIKELLAPNLLETPYHHVEGIPKGIYNTLRSEALVIDAFNILAHAYKKAMPEYYGRLMAKKDRLITRLSIDCEKLNKSLEEKRKARKS